MGGAVDAIASVPGAILFTVSRRSRATRRRQAWYPVVAVIGVVMIAVVLAVTLSRPTSTVDRVHAWLDDHCASVDHERRRAPAASWIPAHGLQSDDVLVCDMLGGEIDVMAYRSVAARTTTLRAHADDLQGSCLVGPRELVVDSLLTSYHGRIVRQWCDQLHGDYFGRVPVPDHR